MKTTMLVLACCLCGGHALAAETSVLIFGASHHGSCDASRWNCDLNNSNPGLGLELAEPQVDYSLFVRGGGYRPRGGQDTRRIGRAALRHRRGEIATTGNRLRAQAAMERPHDASHHHLQLALANRMIFPPRAVFCIAP